ncbi:MAG: hypothetical protein QF819_00005 [Gemmatimonadota bacterium]|nr:hypothetical protein [Gemmatimonadota bacterium]MDP6528065.1 hypothetical protein [Gemmatimonadota bacterium]MDP6801545.1 hypothetical protein [Gemmatimonadota bacterium]MDP7030908.1 hypothetical protein [Gemmatimonadota bacterium]
MAEEQDGITLPKAPIQVKTVLYYRDGGTTGLVLEDSDGKEFKLCLDGRMQKEEVGTPLQPWLLYVGATHPLDTGAVMIAEGGVEEKAILTTLETWLSDNVSDEKREKLLTAKGVPGLSVQEVDQLRILRVVNYLKKRNEPNKSMDHDRT